MTGAHLEPEDGEQSGRDPREMTPGELNALGHEKRPLGKVIRAKCLDCCCGNMAEVRRCVSVTCALWPYRMRKNPFSERTANPAGAEALAAWRRNNAAPDGEEE